MDHIQSVNAIQTQDLPAFLTSLEEAYGKEWVQKNFAFMAIVCEQGSAGMFRTIGNGNNANLMKIGHAVIRSLGKMIHDQDPKISERDAIHTVISTIFAHINGDLSREGIPETIFDAMTAEESDTPTPDVEQK